MPNWTEKRKFIWEAEKVGLQGNTLREKMYEEQLRLQYKGTL